MSRLTNGAVFALPTGRVTRPGRGFTLIELLVALLIVGVVVSFAVLSVSGQSVRERQRAEARRLLARMDLAREEAVLQARSLGIRLTPAGYRFLALGAGHGDDGDDAGGWRAVEGELLAPRELPDGIRLAVDVDGLEIALDAGVGDGGAAGEPRRPQIFFLAGGEIMPGFSVRVLADDTGVEYEIAPGDERWLTLTEERL